MKIVTVNIPESYLESIKRLIGEEGLYPSRSELIRCAVRDFLIKELKNAEEILKYQEAEVEEIDDKNFVRVPNDTLDENNEPVREFKTYKIISKLDYNESSDKKIKPQGRKRKKLEPLGNRFWVNKLDEYGNLIRIPKN